MVVVQVREYESIERALRRFKKKHEKAGILKDLRNHRYYSKPSEEKRMRKIKSIRRLRQALRLNARQLA